MLQLEVATRYLIWTIAGLAVAAAGELVNRLAASRPAKTAGYVMVLGGMLLAIVVLMRSFGVTALL